MANDVFMALRNDKERMAFLDDYANDVNAYWYLAKMLTGYDRRFFAYRGTDYTVYVEDELQTMTWPKRHEKWISRSFYLVPDEPGTRKPFADYRMSKTMIINWIKERRKLSENSGGGDA